MSRSSQFKMPQKRARQPKPGKPKLSRRDSRAIHLIRSALSATVRMPAPITLPHAEALARLALEDDGA